MAYILLVIWIIIIGLLCAGRYLNFNRNKNSFWLFTMIVLILFMGVRNSTVGADTVSYMRYYKIVADSDFREIISGWMFSSMEIGYCVFMKLCSMIIKDYYFFQMLQSCLFVYLMMKFIKDNTNSYFFSCCIFLGIGMYTLAFNIARQMLAVAIIATAWTELLKNNRIKVLFLLLIATSIHTTALVFLIVYFIYCCRENPKLLRIMPILAIVVAFNYNYFIEFAQSHVKRFSNYYGNWRSTYTAGYVRVLWAVIVMLSLAMVYRRDNRNMQSVVDCEENNIIIYEQIIYGIFSIIYVITQVIGMFFNYFDRIGLFFEPFVILVFDKYAETIKSISVRRLFYVSVTCCFLIYFLISCISSSQYQYTTFF